MGAGAKLRRVLVTSSLLLLGAPYWLLHWAEVSGSSVACSRCPGATPALKSTPPCHSHTSTHIDERENWRQRKTKTIGKSLECNGMLIYIYISIYIYIYISANEEIHTLVAVGVLASPHLKGRCIEGVSA